MVKIINGGKIKCVRVKNTAAYIITLVKVIWCMMNINFSFKFE